MPGAAVHAAGHAGRAAGAGGRGADAGVGRAGRARAPDRVADAGAPPGRAGDADRAAGPGPPVRAVARGRRRGGRPRGRDRRPGGARRSRPRGDHRADGPGRVAVPARRAAVAAGGRGDRGGRVRDRPAVGHRGGRAAGRPAGRVHRLPVAGAVPAGAGGVTSWA
jgi:hypothetical protein